MPSILNGGIGGIGLGLIGRLGLMPGVCLTSPSTTTTTTTSPEQSLLNDVVTLYNENAGVSPINETDLQNAITQAQTEMRTDALQTRLQNPVSEGKLTQDQVNQILSWWQSMPSVLNGNAGLGLMGGPGMMHGADWFLP